MVIEIKGFSEEVNAILSELICMYSDRIITTNHVVRRLMELNDIEYMVRSLLVGSNLEYGDLVKVLDNEIMDNKARKGVLRTIYREYIESELDLEGINFSEDLVMVIEALLSYHASSGEIITNQDMLEFIVNIRYTAFSKLIMKYGIQLDGGDNEVDDEVVDGGRVNRNDGFTALNITEMASKGVLDKVVCRDKEIGNIIEILTRKNKGSVCIVGDSGVGKTSLVYGVAQRIVSGRVHSSLKDKIVLRIDIPTLIAGTRFRGDLEDRVSKIMMSVMYNGNIILYFDDFHLLFSGVGGVTDSMSIFSIMRPFIENSNVKIIGTTTPKEFNKILKIDNSIEQRIQTLYVTEPSIDDSIKIVNSAIKSYVDYHGVKVDSDFAEWIVKLSDRYLPGRKLPGKAIDLVDITLAMVKNRSKVKKASLSDIKLAISNITGIDIKDLDKTERDKLLNLDKAIKMRVVGQDEAIDEIVKAIKRNKSGVVRNNRPIGSFMFIGATGVGKTEVAKVLAKELFGSERNMVRLDMSEYMEKHAVSKLIGAPPGYVGFEDGGQLTSIVKNKPYSLILFDEIEKAHPDVINILLQILEDGRLTDSRGNVVDFKNTIIIMTSNVGYQVTKKVSSLGFNSINSKVVNEKVDIMKELENTFRPEFINRLDRVVVFNRLTKENIRDIVKIMLADVSANVSELGIEVQFSDKVVDYISNIGFSDKYGARNIRRKIQEVVEDYLSDELLAGNINKGDRVVIDFDGFTVRHKVKSLVCM
ncbi:MAG: ATP-dependent Clp protease ATP-binding subunit [Candidatus Anstonellales archaeon]